jgi:hypothetical protein
MSEYELYLGEQIRWLIQQGRMYPEPSGPVTSPCDSLGLPGHWRSLAATWRQRRGHSTHTRVFWVWAGMISSRDLPYLFLPQDTKTCRWCSSRNGRATVAALPLVISITFVGMRFAPSSHPLSSILQPRSVTIRSNERWHGAGPVDPGLAVLTRTESAPVARRRTASARAGCPFPWWSEPVVPARI